jgi:asparagine N-glycosylation enzyme membrane subunit Stt3
MLGFTDHHILEVVLVTVCLLLVIVGTHRHNYAWFLGALGVFIVYAMAWIGWPLQVAVFGGWLIGWVSLKIWRRGKSKERIAVSAVLVAGAVLVGIVPLLRNAFMVFLSNTFLGFTGTILEVSPVDLYSFYVLYGLSGFIAFMGIALAIRNKISGLFMVWGVFFMIAMVFEKRWGYYGVIPVALFTGYLISWAITKVSKDWRGYVLAYCCIMLLVTTSAYSLGIAKRQNDITPDWYNACQWLKSNTPEPFSTDDSYNKLDPGKPEYGVFTWWDYGHYIIQVAHRVPLCSPTQQESPFYKFFTDTDEVEANKVIQDIPGYIVLDSKMVNEKFYAIWGKVNGTSAGWQDRLPQSMVYKMYNGQSETWVLIHQEGDVKIFERRVVEDGNRN